LPAAVAGSQSTSIARCRPRPAVSVTQTRPQCTWRWHARRARWPPCVVEMPFRCCAPPSCGALFCPGSGTLRLTAMSRGLVPRSSAQSLWEAPVPKRTRLGESDGRGVPTVALWSPRRVRPRPRTAVASPASPRRAGTREKVRTAMLDHTARRCGSGGRGGGKRHELSPVLSEFLGLSQRPLKAFSWSSHAPALQWKVDDHALVEGDPADDRLPDDGPPQRACASAAQPR
jgi:hypothetical protein